MTSGHPIHLTEIKKRNFRIRGSEALFAHQKTKLPFAAFDRMQKAMELLNWDRIFILIVTNLLDIGIITATPQAFFLNACQFYKVAK